MEIYSVDKTSRVKCHLAVELAPNEFDITGKVDKAVIELDKKYPDRQWLICPALYLRVVRDGKVVYPSNL
jgi:hypothetical protein